MKVLIVDDSVVFRMGISKVLESVKDISKISVAGNGKIALDMIKNDHFDLVTIDIEMPIMDGPEAIDAIRSINKEIKIIVFSSQTLHSCEKTLKVLTAGKANDFVRKMPSGGTVESSLEMIKAELLPKILQFLPESKTSQSKALDLKKTSPDLTQMPLIDVKPKVICIGTSTGGPDALKKIFSQIKCSIKVPILIVQHMPPLFTKQLAIMLSNVSGVKVKEAEQGEVIKKGYAYIAPGDYHMRVSSSTDNSEVKILLDQGPKVCSVRPAVDILFKSVAQRYGELSWNFVLTGMGQDGLEGARELVKRHAKIFIQDKSSSTVWGMPGAIFEANLPSSILDLSQVVFTILKCQDFDIN